VSRRVRRYNPIISPDEFSWADTNGIVSIDNLENDYNYQPLKELNPPSHWDRPRGRCCYPIPSTCMMMRRYMFRHYSLARLRNTSLTSGLRSYLIRIKRQVRCSLWQVSVVMEIPSQSSLITRAARVSIVKRSSARRLIPPWAGCCMDRPTGRKTARAIVLSK